MGKFYRNYQDFYFLFYLVILAFQFREEIKAFLYLLYLTLIQKTHQYLKELNQANQCNYQSQSIAHVRFHEFAYSFLFQVQRLLAAFLKVHQIHLLVTDHQHSCKHYLQEGITNSQK